MIRLLAIDPGSIRMGLSLFDGPDLVGTRSLAAPEKWSAELRLSTLMGELSHIVHTHRPQALAMERPGAGNPAHRPPTLLTLCTFIRQAAAREWKISVTEYATGTITAEVRLRGFPAKDRKAALRAGVVAIYGERYLEAPQDVVDAIAVGHTFLVKAREAALLAQI